MTFYFHVFLLVDLLRLDLIVYSVAKGRNYLSYGEINDIGSEDLSLN
jgi:hypothetical protein